MDLYQFFEDVMEGMTSMENHGWPPNTITMRRETLDAIKNDLSSKFLISKGEPRLFGMKIVVDDLPDQVKFMLERKIEPKEEPEMDERDEEIQELKQKLVKLREENCELKKEAAGLLEDISRRDGTIDWFRFRLQEAEEKIRKQDWLIASLERRMEDG